MPVLYIVPTPIGNLADITFRAVNVLKEADLILAEDTRTSSVLLKHYGITTRMKSYHKFNEHKVSAFIEDLFAGADTIALVSDAGTPGISDPGYLLIRTCIENNIKVECLPGATAFVPALICSGLPSDTFSFLGFLPVKKGRQTMLRHIAAATETTVVYESPHRILRTLNELASLLEQTRKVSVSREISKKFEETFRGTALEVYTHFSNGTVKGEFVLVIQGAVKHLKEDLKAAKQV